MSKEGQVASWDDAHRYSPAPRHRRRLITRMVEGLDFGDCLDAGCAQPYLLEKMNLRGVPTFGCDISAEVIRRNAAVFPYARFERLDLVHQVWPGGRQFDLVICSEVLEHVEDWQAALANLAKMCRRHLLITVPAGRIYPIDLHIGHLRHFTGSEITSALGAHGLAVARLRRWGWPVHSMYKRAINAVMPQRLYLSFGETQYGLGKKLFSNAISLGFYINDLFPWGAQLMILARRPGPEEFLSSGKQAELAARVPFHRDRPGDRR